MHQIQTAIDEIRAALKDATDASPLFLATSEKAEAILALEQIKAGVEELELRVLAVAQDVADEIGARDIGTWLTGREIADGPTARRELRLAHELEERPVVRTGLCDGLFSVDHARIIVNTLVDLPAELDLDLAAKAEAHLCDLATRHRPSDLRRLARHLHGVIDPEHAEEAEGRALQRSEAAADARAALSITSRGDGMTRIHALVTDAVGARLRTLLEAYAQPRIAALEADGRVRPRSRILAEALGQLLEYVDSEKLPTHGGDSTTLIVTMTLDQLRSDLGVATMVDGTSITAAEARRLACGCGIIPTVLGGLSEPLDLGRTRRLFSPAQRKALKLRDQHCRAEGCTVPATWCDAHHHDPWHRGGNTNVTDGILLCGHHHRRAHDPAYATTKLANGDYRYHRRAWSRPSGSLPCSRTSPKPSLDTHAYTTNARSPGADAAQLNTSPTPPAPRISYSSEAPYLSWKYTR